MSTFFSGTDLNTLREEGNDRNHFVSLIVNNEGKYTAAITRKVKYSAVRELSYESFGSSIVDLPEKETFTGEEIQYFNLEIVFEEAVEDQFKEISDRLNLIKEAKAKASKEKTPSYTPGNGYGGYDSYWQKSKEDNTTKTYQPSLFKELDETKVKPSSVVTNFDKETGEIKEKKGPITDELIKGIINQLITGSVTVTKLDDDTQQKLINTMPTRFINRFGKGEIGMFNFKMWATDFVEFLIWYSVDEDYYDEGSDTVTKEIADKTVAALRKLSPTNDYIKTYIDLFLSYADRF